MVWIFKTSIQKQKEVKQVKPKLDKVLLPAANWNFDLEDCDNILRVEAESLQPQSIEQLLMEAGFECEELD
jgi:hypothetical protein